MVDIWRPIYDAQVKQKAHNARGSGYDLFMIHRDVLKPSKKQRFTHYRRRKMHRILSLISKHFDSECVMKKNANVTINFIKYTLQIDSDECN